MLAFTFPGQGSQQPGMGRPWADHPSWSIVAAASEASGRDVAALLLDADAEELKRTENAQLSTYVLSLVVHDAITRLGVRGARAAGHSLGEYSALTAVGALRLEDGVRLVTERGRRHAGRRRRPARHDGRGARRRRRRRRAPPARPPPATCGSPTATAPARS